MKIQSLETTFLSDPNLSKFQDNLINFTNQFLPLIFLKGNLLENVSLTTTAIKLEHKLGTNPLGYLIMSQNTNAVIYSTAKDQNFLTMQSSANVVVSVWIF